MPEKINDNYKKQDLKDKVQDYMDVCESDYESKYHWQYLKAIYNKLSEREDIPKCYHAMMAKLEDFMSKYGIYDSGENQANMTAENRFKYRKD